MTTVDEVKGRAQGFIIGQIGAGSKQFGELLKNKAKSVRTVGEALRDRGEAGPGQVADLAAERLERVAKYFSKTDGEQLVADLEGLARKNPLLTVGAGFAVGLFSARLLKASAGRRHKEASRRVK
ncbi:MAG TPA: hypothetical protein VK760_07795 [Candidatus Acidoferrales bacterium]|nr:hypothetical protein [Candidatus Acidoferrales bacterium]